MVLSAFIPNQLTISNNYANVSIQVIEFNSSAVYGCQTMADKSPKQDGVGYERLKPQELKHLPYLLYFLINDTYLLFRVQNFHNQQYHLLEY
ncbi:MAG: hypothetical protein ABIJ53_01115, partial [Verrucomicrobiota bacterium]